MTANEIPRPVQKRIMVVDDHPMTRNGIADWIRREQDLSVCAEAQNAEQALDAVSKSKPDLVLTDITLPGKSGLELIKDLRAMQPDLPVLVVSMHDECLYAERVLRAGARGYIMKHESGDDIIRAIRRVLSGKLHVSEQMSARILEGVSGRQPATQYACNDTRHLKNFLTEDRDLKRSCHGAPAMTLMMGYAPRTTRLWAFGRIFRREFGDRSVAGQRYGEHMAQAACKPCAPRWSYYADWPCSLLYGRISRLLLAALPATCSPHGNSHAHK